METRVFSMDRIKLCGLVLAAAILAGCKTVPPENALALSLSLDADSYGIGQPVQATVKVKNMTDADLLLTSLDHRTLRFLVGQPGEVVRKECRPVSPKNIPSDRRWLRPRGATQRTFLFTRLTREPGRWGLLAGLSGFHSRKYGDVFPPRYYSNTAEFEVTETVKFRRDPNSGLITKEQAVELVRSHLELGEDANVKGVLMLLDDADVCVWTVLVGEKDDSSAETRWFTVNAYSGIVKPLEWKETVPATEPAPAE